MTAADYAESYKDETGQWRFRVKAGNGEIIFTGEGYVRRIDSLSVLSQRFPGIAIVDLDAENGDDDQHV